MTIQKAIYHTQSQLSHLPHSLLIAQSILAKLFNQSTSYLWAHPDKILTPSQQDSLTTLTKRAQQHEPLAYLLGYKEFYGRRFQVNSDTLIPRPETENIVDRVKKYLSSSSLSSPTIVDVGTGSGCLAITLALEIPQSQIVAIDISPKALEVATQNANHYQVTASITFLQGSLLEPFIAHPTLSSKPIDILVANLPYISDQEYVNLPDTIKNFEPPLALKSGPHPDHLNHQLIEQAQPLLHANSLFLYETTNGQIVDASPSTLTT